MACGDWIVRKMNHSRYIIAENHSCYAVILSKKHYDENILELIEAVLK